MKFTIGGLFVLWDRIYPYHKGTGKRGPNVCIKTEGGIFSIPSFSRESKVLLRRERTENLAVVA